MASTRRERTRRVAFATYRQSPDISDDDRLAADALSRRGITVEAAVWDAPDVEWDRFDLVVVRSTWDFHLNASAYAGWVRRFLDDDGRLWNPPPMILDNLDKRYLIDLARRGVPVVPTVHVTAGDQQRLADLVERYAWEDVVVKPAVSASARGTWRSSRAGARRDEERFATQLRDQDLLVQPYCPEIATRGEWSLIFFDGEWSHAVLKRPAHGDFRVQRHFGGQPVGAVPNAKLIEQAGAILARVPDRLLYARVDGIERDGNFVLMELELNEPSLFLSFSETAALRFADAIVNLVRKDARRT